MPEPDAVPPDLDRVGLCRSCRHARIVRSDTGSTFYLCGLSRVDPSFPKYPRTPVLSCRGYERASSPEDP